MQGVYVEHGKVCINFRSGPGHQDADNCCQKYTAFFNQKTRTANSVGEKVNFTSEECGRRKIKEQTSF